MNSLGHFEVSVDIFK